MSARWEKAVAGFEYEAAAILEEHGFPTNAAELLAFDKDPPDHMVNAARFVILGADRLRKEVARGKMSYALDKLYQVCSDYEEMFFLKLAPEYRKTPLHKRHQILFDVARGLKVILAARDGGKTKGTPTKVVERWQAQANEIWKRNPRLSIRAVATKIAGSSGDTFNTIRTKIKKPAA